jgi:hypothetical protein
MVDEMTVTKGTEVQMIWTCEEEWKEFDRHSGAKDKDNVGNPSLSFLKRRQSIGWIR